MFEERRGPRPGDRRRGSLDGRLARRSRWRPGLTGLVTFAAAVMPACADDPAGESASGETTVPVTDPAVTDPVGSASAGPSSSQPATAPEPAAESESEASPASDPTASSTTSTTNEAANSTTTPDTTVVPAPSAVADLVDRLSADELGGRDNDAAGGAKARRLLIAELETFAQPLDGADGFEHPFADGVNLVGLIPGRSAAGEFVVVGAHFDHISVGRGCTPSGGDAVCNGAGDNATGVGVAIDVGRRIASSGTNERSVLITLFDAEEDNLLGSRAFVDTAIVPAESIVAMVNLDILGTNMTPSLSTTTLVFGAATGGDMIVEAVSDALARHGLEAVHLGLVFAQGRSDHAPFAAAGVPVVFLGDGTNGCYHTVDDEFEQLDLDKLDRQASAVGELVAALADGDLSPDRAGSGSPATFDDLLGIERVARGALADRDLLDEQGRATVERVAAELADIAAAGPAEYGGDDTARLLLGANEIVTALVLQPCRAS